MSGQWREAANRGALDLVVMTRKYAQEAGIPLREGCPYAAFVLPTDGLEPWGPLGFRDFAAVGSWCHEMAPLSITFWVGSGENKWTLYKSLGEYIELAASGTH